MDKKISDSNATQEEIKNSKMFKEIKKSLEKISEQEIHMENKKLGLFSKIKNWIKEKIWR